MNDEDSVTGSGSSVAPGIRRRYEDLVANFTEEKANRYHFSEKDSE